MKIAVCLLVSLFLNAHAFTKEIQASATTGTLGFAGEHAGMAFEGSFTDWQATIVLPPADQPKITATFALASAETGDSIYDSTLPEGDWFDIENHPVATFQSEVIEPTTDNEYRVAGTLGLRGKMLPVEFILRSSGDALMANFVIDRLAYGIGMESDPDAEWVSQDISMTLVIPIP